MVMSSLSKHFFHGRQECIKKMIPLETLIFIEVIYTPQESSAAPKESPQALCRVENFTNLISISSLINFHRNDQI